MTLNRCNSREQHDNTCNLPVLKIILDELLILSQREQTRYLSVRYRIEKYTPDRQIVRVIFPNQVPRATVV